MLNGAIKEMEERRIRFIEIFSSHVFLKQEARRRIKSSKLTELNEYSIFTRWITKWLPQNIYIALQIDQHHKFEIGYVNSDRDKLYESFSAQAAEQNINILVNK